MYIYIPKHNMTQVSHSPGRITTMILRFAAKVMHTSDKMNPPTSANNNNNSTHRETEGEEPSTCYGATNGVVP